MGVAVTIILSGTLNQLERGAMLLAFFPPHMQGANLLVFSQKESALHDDDNQGLVANQEH